MKLYGLLVGLFLAQAADARTISVENIKVSVNADSAGVAREQALEQAHQLAFQKFVEQVLPDATVPLPPADILQDMVSDFSIDREKTTATSYAASLTFQFDEPRLAAWLQQFQSTQPQIAAFSQPKGQLLNIRIQYASHKEWQHIKRAFSGLPGMQAFDVSSLSPQGATIDVTYEGTSDQLAGGLRREGISLSQQNEGWVASLDGGLPQ
jgi:hypothetical protein